MSDQRTGPGWQPLSKPNLTRPDFSRPGASADAPGGSPRNLNQRLNVDGSPIVTAFVRLARTHAFHAAGDAAVLVALAGTFFALDANGARSKILLYLILTMAPFSLVGPLIGPALDRMRGGRRLMIILTMAARAGLMVLMIRNIDTVWLFPIAFAQLVLGKTYSVAKAATVPTTVSNDDELVEKNSRLAVLTAVAGGVGGAPAFGLQALFGSTATLSFAALLYVIGVIAALQMPRVFVDNPSTDDDDGHEIRSAGVTLASWATAMIRGVVGFVLFLLIFEFGRADKPDLSGIGTAVGAAVKSALGFDLIDDPGPPRWKVAIPFAFWSLGMFGGNIIAPRLRRRFTEDNMILGALVAVAAAAIAALWTGGISGAALLALTVGTSASAAKLAFDSLVQRDAPGANHGAAFGRFETRFQIAWVIGALLSVVIPFPLRAGFLVVAIAASAVAVFMLQQGTLNFGRTGRSGRASRAASEAAPAGDDSSPAPGGSSGLPKAPITTAVPAVGTAAHPAPATPQTNTRPPAPPTPPAESTGADPYGEAFAERSPEPADWASSLFRDQHDQGTDDTEALAPPDWLRDASASNEPNPTPPMGNDPIT